MTSFLIERTTNPTKSRTQTQFILACGLICVIILALLAASLFLANRVKGFSEVQTDDAIWNYTQVEVEYLRFQSDLSQALVDTPEGSFVSPQQADRITHSFDLLFARIDTLRESSSTLKLPQNMIDSIEEIHVLRNDLAKIVDHEHPYTHAAISSLLQMSNREHEHVRNLIIAALHTSIDVETGTRTQLQTSLSRFLLVASILLLFASVTAISMMYLWRENGLQNREQERISSYLFNVVEASQDVIVVLDDTFCITEFNTAAQATLGCDRNMAIGQSIIDCFTPPMWRDVFASRLQNILNDPENMEDAFVNTRVWAQRINGDPFPAELTIVRERGIQGEPILIGFLRDTSEEVKARANARDALAQAQSDAATKSRFLATMSHEMRTPLHGVIASLDMIDIKSLNLEAAEYIHMARDASTTALEQTEDVLDVAQRDASFDPSTPVTYNSRAIIKTIANQVRALSTSRGNTLEVSWSGHEENYGLRRSFSRAIYNLLSNAIKFTENGRITVKGQNIEIDGILTTHVEISDTGTGITDLDKALIFEDFYSNTSTSDHTLSSTGLGLGIVQRSVEALGGTIEYTSQIGKGSTFKISFPAHTHNTDESSGQTEPEDTSQRPATPDIPLPSSQQVIEYAHLMHGKTALIIEDHCTNRHLIERMAERLGYEVETAFDGINGLEKAFDKAYDLILTDVNMPNLDGLNTAKCIRTLSKSRAACIVAVTAHAEMDDIDGTTIFDYGINGLISKPFTQDQLHNKLITILEEREEMASDSTEQTSENLFDLSDLLEMGLPKDNIIALIGRSKLDVETVQNLLRQALSTPNAADYLHIAETAHHAAGSIYFLGSKDIGDLLITIEKISKAEDIKCLKGLDLILQKAMADFNATFENTDMLG